MLADTHTAKLEERVADLEERVAWLESELGLIESETAVHKLRQTLGFGNAAARLLFALYQAKGRVLTRPFVEDFLGTECVTPRKLIDLYVYRIRKVLGREALETAWGTGYALSSIGRERVREVLAA